MRRQAGRVRRRRARAGAKGRDARQTPLEIQREDWLRLSPTERHRRAWRMRRLLPDPRAVHDAKLWPKP